MPQRTSSRPGAAGTTPSAVERGIPSHVTILFPLVPAAEVDDDLLSELRGLVPPAHARSAYELARLETFPGVAWLAPDPAAPFHVLIERTRAAFPHCPPYGDPALEPVPHCTVGVTDDPAGARGDGRRAALGARAGDADPLRGDRGGASRGARGRHVVDACDVSVRRAGMSHFRRLSIRVRGNAEAEPLRARLLELVPVGFEEREIGGRARARGLRPARGRRGAPRGAPGAADVEPVPEGWEDAWRSFHHPVTAGGLWVGPPWEEAPDPARAVVIDPGRAFGTGAHPTTRLCVELLAATPPRGSLLDVGCGSGVLAIAGARLGFAPVVAVDVDSVAVETTRVNAAANGVAVDAFLVDAEAEPLPAADVAVANVLLRPVEAILARLDGREAITSGYLVGERPAHDGWSHVETVELDDGLPTGSGGRDDRRPARLIHADDVMVVGKTGARDASRHVAARSRRIRCRKRPDTRAQSVPRSRASNLRAPMATFSTRFLGCKVSFADAQAIRERLLADGHSEVDDGGEIAGDQHLLRHPRGRLEVPPGGRAGGALGAHGVRHRVRVEPRRRLRRLPRRTSS